MSAIKNSNLNPIPEFALNNITHDEKVSIMEYIDIFEYHEYKRSIDRLKQTAVAAHNAISNIKKIIKLSLDSYTVSKNQSLLVYYKRVARENHVAYCLIRGNLLSNIEHNSSTLNIENVKNILFKVCKKSSIEEDKYLESFVEEEYSKYLYNLDIEYNKQLIEAEIDTPPGKVSVNENTKV